MQWFYMNCFIFLGKCFYILAKRNRRTLILISDDVKGTQNDLNFILRHCTMSDNWFTKKLEL